jgi:hypothetical protein
LKGEGKKRKERYFDIPNAPIGQLIPLIGYEVAECLQQIREAMLLKVKRPGGMICVEQSNDKNIEVLLEPYNITLCTVEDLKVTRITQA